MMWCKTSKGGRWTVSTGLAREGRSANSNGLISADFLTSGAPERSES